MFNIDMNLYLEGRAAECQEMVGWFCVCGGSLSYNTASLEY